jgi:hypothetical protein
MSIKILDLPYTTPALALKSFDEIYKEKTGKNWQGLDKELNMKLKSACGGGRIILPTNLNLEKFNSIKNECISLDITSSYSGSMYFNKFPLANMKPIISNTLPTDYKNGFSIIFIKIHNYYSDLPIILHRDSKTNSPVYGVGTFTATITNFDYEYLIEHKTDYEKIEVFRVYYWHESKCGYIFRPYIDKFLSMKKRGDKMNSQVYGSGDAYREVAKLMLNSLFGKFLEKYFDDESKVFSIKKTASKYQVENLIDEKENFNKKEHRHYAIGAAITSISRLNLYKAINYYGVKNVFYSDTDSIKILKSVYDSKEKPTWINDELGGWKFEGVIDDLIIHAPKCYSYVNKKHKSVDGKKCVLCYQSIHSKECVTNKVKGLPLKFSIQNGKNELDNTLILNDKIRESIKSNSELVVKYKPTPNTFMGFLRSGQNHVSAIKTMTNREKVTGLKWDENQGVYNFINLGV